jgi:hypothetical protein
MRLFSFDGGCSFYLFLIQNFHEDSVFACKFDAHFLSAEGTVDSDFISEVLDAGFARVVLVDAEHDWGSIGKVVVEGADATCQTLGIKRNLTVF